MKLFLVGGFLGSGKTTAIQQASLELLRGDTKVGVITNDQGVQLVDSQFIQSFNIPTREVTAGCFCCNYENFEQSIQSLLKESQPDVIFAESVGSCTDLISTVINPLEKFYPDRNLLVSIFADARILPMLVKKSSYFFDDEIHYIYKKQLEEADILVVNKIDLLSSEELSEVKQLVESRYSGKKILYQNSLARTDINQWLSALYKGNPVQHRTSLDIDYYVYGEGEAKLGWLDAAVEMQTTNGHVVENGYKLINEIYTTIHKENLPIGHLKFLLDDGNRQKKISFTLTNQPEVQYNPDEYETDNVKMLINARVQTSPNHLQRIVINAINKLEAQEGGNVVIKKMEAFKPGYPTPTHRIIS